MDGKKPLTNESFFLFIYIKGECSEENSSDCSFLRTFQPPCCLRLQFVLDGSVAPYFPLHFVYCHISFFFFLFIPCRVLVAFFFNVNENVGLGCVLICLLQKQLCGKLPLVPQDTTNKIQFSLYILALSSWSPHLRPIV